MNNDSTFNERKQRRMATWKGSITVGFPVEERVLSGSSPEENLAHLETLRKMLYSGLSNQRMNKNITNIKKQSPPASHNDNR